MAGKVDPLLQSRKDKFWIALLNIDSHAGFSSSALFVALNQ
ncbi:hypothetical protein ACP_1220 [Acidobacterium capsulatum ATCC 51196]|uniref:Uncharacterized protein n=1 Tax=Acidobacterium capsulatum (strain ATCC 51196 / DSM 11244 / BCRC 80197 / JCM 7670 / NBRC 15755 / NCIMB 13165 / 161) TaxID=240015 RepID=C1F4U9_ACIC5|nr:hypothetical protein ACP_1220 [Acidobacterium capsulatum ATCC 51196]